jgi:hypothetical protein
MMFYYDFGAFLQNERKLRLLRFLPFSHVRFFGFRAPNCLTHPRQQGDVHEGKKNLKKQTKRSKY